MSESREAPTLAFEDYSKPAGFLDAYHPEGVLGEALSAISNPRKHRWNRYLRACKAIPDNSPVAGSSDFNEINERRHELIGEMFSGGEEKYQEVNDSVEYVAVCEAVSAWVCGPVVAQNFLMSRFLRRHREERKN